MTVTDSAPVPPDRIDVPIVLGTAAALGVVIGAFALAVRHAGKAATAREEPDIDWKKELAIGSGAALAGGAVAALVFGRSKDAQAAELHWIRVPNQVKPLAASHYRITVLHVDGAQSKAGLPDAQLKTLIENQGWTNVTVWNNQDQLPLDWPADDPGLGDSNTYRAEGDMFYPQTLPANVLVWERRPV